MAIAFFFAIRARVRFPASISSDLSSSPFSCPPLSSHHQAFGENVLSCSAYGDHFANNAENARKEAGRAAVVIAGIDSERLFDGFYVWVGFWEIVFSEMRTARSPKL